MMGLVDYEGSDSDSDNEDNNVPEKTIPKSLLTEDLFLEENNGKEVFTIEKNDVLEDIVKPKDWEIKMAEKARKKLEKKAKKAAKKEKKKLKKEKKLEKIGKGIIKKQKGKVIISAFGALASSTNNDESDSDDEKDNKAPLVANTKGKGFLANLPAPKGKNNLAGGPIETMKSLVPPSVSKKSTNIVNNTPIANLEPKFIDESDDEEDDISADFFGFSSVSKPADYIPDIPQMPSTSSMEMVGPSKPSSIVHPSQMYNMADVDMEEDDDNPIVNPNDKIITDEQAHKLLLRFSHDIGPEEKRSINEMTASIVDVKVDDAIGPDVKSTILKNLSHRAFSEATSAPLPQVKQTGQLSRRKHQITYLANLAVQKEEALKEQWADQRQSKRMARAKYGF